MNRYRRVVILILCIAAGPAAAAQYAAPVDYMNYLGAIESDMARDYLSYMSAMAHTSNARKMEKRRQEILSTIREGRSKVEHLRPFNGDGTLREAYRHYLTILQAVMSEDYGKIVDMEEIAEQSYDKMEAWLVAQEQARTKLHTATDSLRSSYRSFARKNNVTLVDSESKVSKKLELTSRAMAYYNRIFLIHFKAFKQEGYTITALNGGDINGIEQNRMTQITYADEGLEKLKEVKAYENDYSLVISCRKLLEFQKTEAETRIAGLTDFLIKKEEFAKFKKEYDSKPPTQRSKGDIDDYNSFVAEMNTLGVKYNKTNDQLNTSRAALLQGWNGSVDKFLDAHVPH